MAKVFEKMAALSSFSQADLAEFLAGAATLAPGEVGAVLGYLLGRLDSGDAAAMVGVLRALHPQRMVGATAGRPTVNIVGTGGGPSTFNISTTAAFVVAAAGAVVVKTGSGAIRSKSGFADVAARLGTLKVSMPWEEIEAIVADVGIVFIPPSHYPAEMGLLEQNLTVPVYRNAALYFNKIGPLLSPVRVDHRFIGANSPSCLQMLAGACQILGDVPTTLVSSEDGLDEISSSGRTSLIQLTARGRNDESIDPRALGIQPPSFEALAGYEPPAAAECCERILGGQGTAAQADIVALNAGAVLMSLGFCQDLSTGFQTALKILRDGEGLGKLRQLRERVWKCAKH
jgi:anthranilate phosphoribosyltransferase